jgi:hypothetical protein
MSVVSPFQSEFQFQFPTIPVVSKSSVVAFKAPSSSVAPVAPTDEAAWRSLGGVAFQILADLDRRRPKSESTSKAA